MKSKKERAVAPPKPPISRTSPQRPVMEWGSRPVETEWTPPLKPKTHHSFPIDLPSSQMTFHLRNEQKICHICRKIIEINERTVSCPNCTTMFHYPYFAEWVKMKGKCPVCNAELHTK